jgi:hypothetical protein
MTTEKSKPVPPNAVRVWRGYRDHSKLQLDEFYTKLGTVFIPATVLMQIDAGLCSYTPTVPAGLSGKPDTVPDETAILFWESPETYWNGFTRLAVRTYTMTHGGVYTTDGQSRADLPVLLKGSLTVDQPVYLFNKAADWMRGTINHLVAERPAAMDLPTFQTAVATVLTNIQKQALLDGAIACVGNNYLVYWELRPVATGTQTPPSGIPSLKDALTGWSQVFTPAPTFIPVGLWDEWAGMDVRAGSGFNMQFTRRPSHDNQA